MPHFALSPRAIGALAFCFAAGSFAIPTPENIVVFLSAVGLGAGIGAGAGVAAYVSRVGKARAESFKAWDEATRDSNAIKLTDAEHDLMDLRVAFAERKAEADHRIAALEEQVARLESHVARLETERDHALTHLIEVLLDQLRDRGEVRREPPK